MSKTISFLAKIKWNESSEQWRLLYPDGNHMQEFPIYQCPFIGKLAERLGIQRDETRLIAIRLSVFPKANANEHDISYAIVER